MRTNFIIAFTLVLVASFSQSQAAYANSGMGESAFAKWMKVSNPMSAGAMKKSTMKKMKPSNMGGMGEYTMGIFDVMEEMNTTDMDTGSMGNMNTKEKKSPMSAMSKRKMAPQSSMDRNMDEGDDEMAEEMPKKMKKRMRKKMEKKMGNDINKDAMKEGTASMPNVMTEDNDGGTGEEPKPEGDSGM